MPELHPTITEAIEAEHAAARRHLADGDLPEAYVAQVADALAVAGNPGATRGEVEYEINYAHEELLDAGCASDEGPWMAIMDDLNASDGAAAEATAAWQQTGPGRYQAETAAAAAAV